jgi:hypothetical protein
MIRRNGGERGAFEKAKWMAGIIRPVRFHDYGRHSFASNLGSMDANARIWGHPLAGVVTHY